MDYTIHELTQEIGERFIEKAPDGEMSMVRYRGAFVQAAIDAGWVAVSRPYPTLPMKMVTEIFGKLSAVWREANELPNG